MHFVFLAKCAVVSLLDLPSSARNLLDVLGIVHKRITGEFLGKTSCLTKLLHCRHQDIDTAIFHTRRWICLLLAYRSVNIWRDGGIALGSFKFPRAIACFPCNF